MRYRLSLLAALAFLGAHGPAAAEAVDMNFAVLKDGSPIGTHRIRVERAGEETRVAVDIDLQVKLAFVTVYRYAHCNREVWRDGRLVSIDARTDDDGKVEFVRGQATEEAFQVQSTAGTFLAPADVVPTSYWLRSTVQRSLLLDSQRGRLIDVRIDLVDPGPGAAAARYRVQGDLELDLWYDDRDRLRRIAFEYKGARFDYVETVSGRPVAVR